MLSTPMVTYVACAAFAALVLNVEAQNQVEQPEQKEQKKQTPEPVKPVTPSQPHKKNNEVQKIEISGVKGYDERRQDTASKIVVTQEEIVKYGDSTISDVLKRLPGVTVGGGGPGRGGAIRMRGLGSGYTQILLNGEPAPPGFSIESIAPDNVEKIEIFRSATAELSTQAIAGAINITLKKAIVTAQKELKTGFSQEGGSWGYNANLQLSDRIDKLSYALSGNVFHGSFERPSSSREEMLDANNQTILQRFYQTQSKGTFTNVGISPRVNWNLEGGDILTSQSFISANQSQSRNETKAWADVGAAPDFLLDQSHTDNKSYALRSNLNWIHKLADSAKLDARFGVNYHHRDGATHTNAQAQTQNLVRDYDSSSTDKGFTYGGKYTAPFVEDHALAAGWDGGMSYRNESNTRSDVVTGIGHIQALSNHEDFSANISRLALFVQDEWNYSQQLSLYAGLRWEGIHTHSEGNAYATVDNRSSVFSPILQALYKIPGSKNDQFRMGLTRTYKAPETSHLIPRRFYSLNNEPTSPDNSGNPLLKPELALGLDMGFEHYLDEGGVIGVNFYTRRIHNIIRGRVINDGRWLQLPVNDGVATTYGVEFDAKFPLKALIKDAPNMDVRANLAWNQSKVDSLPSPYNRLDSQTPVSANWGVDYKFSEVPLSLGFNYNFQSAGLVRISTKQLNYAIPKRTLDTYALWKFDPKTSLRFSVMNALHQDAYSSTAYSYTGTSVLTRTNLSPSYVRYQIALEHKF